MQRYRFSAHSAWPQTTSNVWQPCRAPTCCPGIAWFAGGARRARSGGTHAAWAMQTEAMARSRREGSACSGVRARLENAALLHHGTGLTGTSGSCYIEYARSCLKRIEAAGALVALLALLYPPARAARTEAAVTACWSCTGVPGRQAQAEHAASLLTSTVCAATTSRLQCRWSLLSSYVVVVECSKLNNAR